MYKMIILTRSNEIYSSPRIEKYIEFFDSNNFNYLTIGWDRNNKKLSRKNTVYFRSNCGYSLGGLKAVWYRILWMLFLLKALLNNSNKIRIIHAFDLDTAFPAVVYKVIFKKNVKVIFDICDWFSATLNDQNKLIRFIFRKMEKFTVFHSDEIFICEPERIEQIPYSLNKSEFVVPNIPSFPDTFFLNMELDYNFPNDKIVISYVGTFGGKRMLGELLNLAEKGVFNLLIAGYGKKEIEERCKSLSNLHNIKYFGKVEYKKGLHIMCNSDIIYAVYSKSNPNNIYAAPNKYYEAMMLGKPLISSRGISLEAKIINYQIGYVINESESELFNLINNLDRKDMAQKGKNAFDLWEKKYKTYIHDFLYTDYIEIIKEKS